LRSEKRGYENGAEEIDIPLERAGVHLKFREVACIWSFGCWSNELYMMVAIPKLDRRLNLEKEIHKLKSETRLLWISVFRLNGIRIFCDL
jgi:hypothetical protein